MALYEQPRGRPEDSIFRSHNPSDAAPRAYATLHAGGGTLDDVTMVTVLLAQPEDFPGMNEAYADFFGDAPPARAVARLGPNLPGILVSILMTAHTDS